MSHCLFFRKFWALILQELDHIVETQIGERPVCISWWINVDIRFEQLNILRCFALPVGYGILLTVAQVFLTRPNNVHVIERTLIPQVLNFNGIDCSMALVHPRPFLPLRLRPTLALIWADGSNTSSNTYLSLENVMTFVVHSLRQNTDLQCAKLPPQTRLPRPRHFQKLSSFYMLRCHCLHQLSHLVQCYQPR